MYCKNCGECAEDGAVFCSNCGEPIGTGKFGVQYIEATNDRHTYYEPNQILNVYDDVGEKIKVIAQVCFVIMAIASFVLGIVIIKFSENLTIAGLLVAALGIFLSYISYILLHGYGELIDRTSEIASILRNNAERDKAR